MRRALMRPACSRSALALVLTPFAVRALRRASGQGAAKAARHAEKTAEAEAKRGAAEQRRTQRSEELQAKQSRVAAKEAARVLPRGRQRRLRAPRRRV